MLTFKQFMATSFLVAGGLLASNTQAQTFYAPALQDFRAPDQNISQDPLVDSHTGTDVLAFKKAPFQVMTWDNSQGKVWLSWSAGNNPVSTNSFEVTGRGGRLSDPDVVLGFGQNGDLYAGLVYVEDGQSYYSAFRFDTSIPGFDPIPAVAPIAMGDANRLHSYPNIDVNVKGDIGIVWQETSTENGSVTVNFPSHSATSPLTVTFADSYMLTGHIDTGLACAAPRGLPVTMLQGSVEPPVLYNLSIHPDVAFSDKGVMSVSFINNYAYTVEDKATGDSPADYHPASSHVEAGTRLIVNQYPAKDLCYTDFKALAHQEWSDGVSADATPRIAASNNAYFEDTDVEVVLDWEGYYCPERIGPVVYREIHNFGKTQGTFRPSFGVVSLPYVVGQSTTPTRLPVVSYSNYQSPDFNACVISWFSVSNASTGEYSPNGSSIDVWSRTFTKGTPFLPDYSRINDNVEGYQYAPSVAARYCPGGGKSSVHLFADKTKQQFSFKLIQQFPGGGSVYRPAPGAGTKADAPSIEAFPNPSSSAVDFNLNLQAGEVVQQLTVVDLLGRVMERVPVSAAQQKNQSVRWTPRTAMPEGSYMVKLVTNQRTENVTIKRHN